MAPYKNEEDEEDEEEKGLCNFDTQQYHRRTQAFMQNLFQKDKINVGLHVHNQIMHILTMDDPVLNSVSVWNGATKMGCTPKSGLSALISLLQLLSF